MITWWQAILLGIVQGLTEFLPVSSSGHLVLFQNILGIGEESFPLLFDTLLHGGTLLAVIAVYARDLWEMIKKPLAKLPLMLILATVPAGLAGVLLQKPIEAAFGGGIWLGIAFAVTGFVLLLTESISIGKPSTAHRRNGRGLIQIGGLDALIIGMAQAAAVFPGVSRSGLTIAGGMCAGFKRSDAAKFAMLMSIPIILASIVLQVIKIKTLPAIGLMVPMLLGMLFAAASGYIAIRWLLRVIIRGNLRPFALYMVALGIYAILDRLVLHWVF